MKSRFTFFARSIAYLRSSYLMRLRRLTYHLTLQTSPYKLKSTGVIEWIFDFAFYIFDVILLPELYECVLCIIKTEYRYLSEKENQMARKFFGDSVQLDFVRINPQMARHIEKKAHAYVTLNTINYRKHISKPILMHELVHIWQYQRFGSMYIYRALKAQRSQLKYDYGGLENLYTGMISQRKFLDFNFEQQGAIVEDYCRLTISPDSYRAPIAMASYEYYLDQLVY